MPSDLYLARKIQGLDHRIDELAREIDGLPKHIAAIESRLASHKAQLASTKETLAENGRQRRQLEGQIGDFKRKISKLQDQMNGARTNAQYHAFQNEIRFCEESIDDLEERILDKMEQDDALEENVTRAEADLKAESAKVAADVEDARQRIRNDEQALGEERHARAALAARMSAPSLREYERVRKARGTAVAVVDGENCSSCHVRLRPKFLQDLRSLSEGILTCESCGLIVHLPDQANDDGVPLEDPAGLQ